MRAIRLIAWRNLSNRPARTLLTAMGVVLGVSLVMAVSISIRSLDQELKAMDAGDAGKAAVVVTPVLPEPFLSESLAKQLQEVTGVAQVLPQVQRGGLLTRKGEFTFIQFFAIDLDAEAGLHTFRVVTGRPPEREGVLLEQRWAQEHGYHLGDLVTILEGGQQRLSWPVTGLIADEGIGRLNGGQVVIVNLTAAQQATGQIDKVTRFLVTGKPGVKPERLAEAIKVILPAGADVGTAGGSLGGEKALKMGLSFFAGVSALVGAFLIFGTLSLALRQRMHEIGVTLAVGATAGQVAAASLLETVGIGLIGCVVGIPVGIGLGYGLIKLEASTIHRAIGHGDWAWTDVWLSLGVGLGVTLLAGIVPIWRASRVSPLEAIKTASVGKPAKGYAAAILGLTMATIGLLSWTWSFKIGNTVLAQVFNVLYFVGVAMAIPLLVRWGVTYLFQPLARRLGAVPVLAAGNLSRNIGRATITVTAMMVAIAMLISMGAVASSWWKGTANYVDSTMAGDLVVGGDITPEVTDAVRQVPGVGALTAEGTTLLQAEPGWHIFASVIDPVTFGQIMPFKLDEGDRDAALSALAHGGAIVLSRKYAEQQGVRLGDTVRFQRQDEHGLVVGSFVQLRVVGLMTINADQGRSSFISQADAAAHFGGVVNHVTYVKLNPSVAPQTVTTAVHERFPGLSVVDFHTLRNRLERQVHDDIVVMDVMLYIALITSALGIFNMLALSVIEQRRELALLRAVGATASQTWAVVMMEAFLLGLVGAVLGLIAGALFAKSFVSGAAEFMVAVAPFQFPVDRAIQSVIAAVLLAVVAALLPAWQAGRLSPAAALRNE